jgi:hypothetical protein
MWVHCSTEPIEPCHFRQPQRSHQPMASVHIRVPPSSSEVSAILRLPLYSRVHPLISDMKAPRACPQCRETKRKCIRPGPGEPCRSCQQRNLQCGSQLRRLTPSISRPVSSEEHPIQPHGQGAHRSPIDLPWDKTAELVEIYLNKVHDQPHSIFHPPTLRMQLRNRSLDGAMLCAICAIGAKFSSNPDRRNVEARLTTEAKRLLQADLENVCLANIQTCILVATLSAGNCQTSSEALFVRKFPPTHSDKI